MCRTAAAGRRPRYRLTLEVLEGRLAPAVLTVNTLADETTADTVLSLREAIGVVDAGSTAGLSGAELGQISGPLGSNDTIQFDPSLAGGTITLTQGALDVTRAVAVTAPGAGSLTLSGGNASRVLLIGQVWSPNRSLVVSLTGLTISGGSAVSAGADYGGGLLNFGTLTVSNCTFSGNAAAASGGGAIYNVGALTLNGCTFTGNTVTSGGDGGAVQNNSSGSLTVTNCTFTGNTATQGGQGAGLGNSGTATVNSSTFSNNTAASNGGGIYNSTEGTLTVSTSTFANNSGGSDGGGIDQDGTATISSSTLSGNSAASEGGGMDSRGPLTLTDCTVYGNTAVSDGGGLTTSNAAQITNCTLTANRVTVGSGGIFGGGLAEKGVAAKLFNTIVAGNFQGAAPGTTADDIAGTVDPASAFNLIGTGGGGGLSNGANGNQVGVSNPGLDNLANNGGPTQTVALLPGSPAIDHGSNAYVTTGETDQRGLTRIVNGTVDLGAFEVQAGSAATTVTVTGFSSPTTAGVAGTFTITVEDAHGNTFPGYLGTVHFTSSDSQAVLPLDYTFTSADAGEHSFTATLKTAGAQSITATDPANSLSASETGIQVTAAAASSLVVAGYPTPTTAGAAHPFTVTAKDPYGNTATGYMGTVTLSSSDAKAILTTTSFTFTGTDAGVHTFSGTLETVGAQSITATDAANSLSASETGIQVTPAAASTVVVAGYPTPTTAGVANPFTVTARDPYGNVATGYAGTVTLSSSDGQAAFAPASYTFTSGDAGVHTFSGTLKTAGAQSITATDTANGLSASEAVIQVTPAAASTLVVAGYPTPTTAGAAHAFTVTAKDPYGNVATGYAGTVALSSSDAKAILTTTSYTFTGADNGVRTFTATLETAGAQSITATDTANSLSASEAGIQVTPAAASTLVVAGYPTPTIAGAAHPFTVTAKDPYGNTASGYAGTVTLGSSDSQAAFTPASYTFTSTDSGVHTFSGTLNTSGTQSITATDTATASTTGTQSGIVVNRATNGAVITVNSVADNTTADNVLTLREAVEYVDGTLGRSLTTGEKAQVSGTLGANNTIQFSLPSGPQTITLTGGALDITKAVTVNGPGANLLTVNGNNLDRVFIIGHDFSQNLSLHVALSGLTIAGGSAVSSGKNYGAGLLNFGTLTLSAMTLSGNTAGSSGGGGLYNDGSVTVGNSTFTGNTVTSGGPGAGIFNNGSGTLTVTGCTFTNNAANSGGEGGGISNDGTASVSGSTFANNTAGSNGAGIHNSTTGKLSLTNSTFTNGKATSDGGAFDNDNTVTATGCTFANNTCGTEGGAIDNHAVLTLTNCTLVGNTAGSRGGAINSTATRNPSISVQVVNCTITGNRVTASAGGGGILQKVPVKLFNTIVAGNFEGSGSTPDDIAGGNVDSTSAFNLIGTGGSGGLSNGVNGNQVGVRNPGLGPLANNGGPTQTVALLPGSPAMDRGSNAYVTAGETDQRGLPRIVNGTVDIGAFEVQAPASASVAGSSAVAVTQNSGVGGGTTSEPTKAEQRGQPHHHRRHDRPRPGAGRRTRHHQRGDGAQPTHAGL